MRLFDTLIGALAPHTCVGCRMDGSLLCATCRTVLARLPGRCSLCRARTSMGVVCRNCIKHNNVSAVYAAVSYAGSSKQPVQVLKFHRAKAAVDVIADVMVQYISMAGFTLVHVPTATTRARMRGYDQAHLIARSCARRARVPTADLLARQGQQRQLGRTKKERSQQLHDVFWVRPLT